MATIKTFVMKTLDDSVFIIKANTKKEADKMGKKFNLPKEISWWTSYDYQVDQDWILKGCGKFFKVTIVE